MATILLPSPLQPQSDTKIIPDKKNYVDDWWNVQLHNEIYYTYTMCIK